MIYRCLKYLLVILVAAFTFSCKVSRVAGSYEEYPGLSEKRFTKEIKKELDFSTLEIGKFVAEYSNGTESKRFKGFIRLVNDSAIMVSIAPIMGIELFRFLGSKDTLKFIDRYNKQFFIDTYGAVNNQLASLLNLSTVQAAILAEPFFDQTVAKKHLFEEKDEFYVISNNYEQNRIKLELTKMYSKALLLKRALINDFTNGSNLEVKYSNYQPLGNSSIPTEMQLRFISGNKIEQLNLTFERIEINKRFNLPFSVSDKYQRLESL